MQTFKRIVHDFIPPFFMRLYQRYVLHNTFSGNYNTWDEACKASSGYDSDIILNKVKIALLKVKNGEAVYERDSVRFDKVQYSWPLLAGLLWIASRNGNKLNIVDFGGSLGSTYYQNIKFLSHLRELRWNIVEQEKFVNYGKHFFENEHVKFYHSLDDCMSEQNAEAILLSGVIQYLERPYNLIEDIIKKNFKYIIFDRTSFLNKGSDLLTIQNVPPQIFKASYPCWFLNVARIMNVLFPHYELIAEFDSEFDGFETTAVKHSVYKGFIFKLKANKIETL